MGKKNKTMIPLCMLLHQAFIDYFPLSMEHFIPLSCEDIVYLFHYLKFNLFAFSNRIIRQYESVRQSVQAQTTETFWKYYLSRIIISKSSSHLDQSWSLFRFFLFFSLRSFGVEKHSAAHNDALTPEKVEKKKKQPKVPV